ncbi:hypothetical protein PDPJ_1_02139 [Photobacterium damselae subsp. piscicida]|nr:hypothetical protein PDPJ_1_02139 [Photobacterium damselae subsp. piscicida]
MTHVFGLLMIKVITMKLFSSIAHFGNNRSIYTGNFTYPSSFGYK